MRAKLIATSLIAGLLISITPALAWGPNGHRITAQIGEDGLSDRAREAVRKIAGKRSLALFATWPDYIRSFPEWDCAKPWHFLTIEDGQDIEDALEKAPRIPRGCDKDLFERLNMPLNVVGAIDYFAAILGGDTPKESAFAELMKESKVEPLNGSVQLTALALLVHLVGDVHQPLHVGRGPDRGGNSITVEWFEKIENLHKVWDEELIENEQLSFSEFAMFLEQEFSDKPPVEFKNGTVSLGARECSTALPGL